jgi:hypothetical protein
MPTSTTRTVVFSSPFKPLFFALCVLALEPARTPAQEPAFTYQGQLTDAGTPANGTYDFQFALFDNDGGGTQVGETQPMPGVVVSNGLFTVDLNFGVSPFTGDSRFLDIGVRPAGGGSFTTLTPRQFISATPYAIHTLSAATADALSSACTSCVQDTQIQSVAGSKVTGTIPVASVPAGSGNYTQNGTTQQPNANFNISGNGTVGGTLSGNVVNAETQFSIGGERVLSTAGSGNLFAGAGAGQANTEGGGANSFVGNAAGLGHETGIGNSFFGYLAGFQQTSGEFNSFFGAGAGITNLTGNNNTAVGAAAKFGLGNLKNATAIGFQAFVSRDNSLVLGGIKGVNDADEDTNVGIGTTAPRQRLHVRGQGLFSADTTTFDPGDSAGAAVRIGYDSNGDYGYINANITGQAAKNLVLQPNNSQGNVGIHTTNPATRLHVVGNTGVIGNLGIGTTAPVRALQIGADTNALFTLEGTSGSPTAGYIRFGDNTGWKLHVGRNREGSAGTLNSGTTTGILMTVQDNGRVGIGTQTPDATLSVNGTASKTGGGFWATLSDERLKNIKRPFTGGLDTVMQLQPIVYEYKPDNALGIRSAEEHIGVGAHAVQKVIPEAVSANDEGYLMVNGDPIMWTMLNAIKEQQHQIEQLRGELRQLRVASEDGGQVSHCERSARYASEAQ